MKFKVKILLGLFTVISIFFFVIYQYYTQYIDSTSKTALAAQNRTKNNLDDSLFLLNRRLKGTLDYGIDEQSGKVVYLGTSTDNIHLDDLTYAQDTAETIARRFLETYGYLFGIKDQEQELKLERITGNFIPFNLSANPRTIHISLFDPTATSHVRFRQYYHQVPVYAGEIIVHLDNSGAVTSVNGKILPDINIPAQPDISAEDNKQYAQDFFRQNYGSVPATVSQPQLYILNPNWISVSPGKISLVWKVAVSGLTTGGNYIREDYFFDAHSGEFITRQTGLFDLLNRYIYDCQETNQCPHWPNDPDMNESKPSNNPEIKNLFEYLGNGYSWFKSHFNLDGPTNFGGTGRGNPFSFFPTATPTPAPNTPIILTGSCSDADGDCMSAGECIYGAIYGPDCQLDSAPQGTICCQKKPPQNNTGILTPEITWVFVDHPGMLAAYDPENGTVYLTSTKSTYSSILPDPVYHEYVHAITQYSAGLIYYSQTGAIHEALSDIFAALITGKWNINILENGREKVLRDLARPAHSDFLPPASIWPPKGCFDWLKNIFSPKSNQIYSAPQPDRLFSPNYYCDFSTLCSLDYSGVHVNNGVPSKTAYLLSQGTADEPNATFNTCQFAGIGPEKTAKIFYQALTTCLVPTSNFRVLADCLVTSCDQLYGKDSTECRTTADAVEATEMIQQPYDRNAGGGCPQLCLFGNPDLGCANPPPVARRDPVCSQIVNQTNEEAPPPPQAPRINATSTPTSTPAPSPTPTPALLPNQPNPPNPPEINYTIYLLDKDKKNRGQGKYYVGEDVFICYTTPAEGNFDIRVSKKIAGTIIPLFTSAENEGCSEGMITTPIGRHEYLLQVYQNSKIIATAQTYISVEQIIIPPPDSSQVVVPPPPASKLPACRVLSNLQIQTISGTSLNSIIPQGQDFFCVLDADKVNYSTVCALRNNQGTVYDICRKYAGYGYYRWKNKTVVFRCNTKCAESPTCDQKTLPAGNYDLIGFDFSSGCGPDKSNVVAKPVTVK